MKNTIRHVQQCTALSFIVSSMILPAKANDLLSSSVVQGALRLTEDAGMVLAISAPVIGAGFMTYCFIRKGMAEPQDGIGWQKRLVTGLYCTVGALITGVLISLVSGYFI